MWLEIDENKQIIGIHSHRSTNDNTWIEHDAMTGMPGDYLVDDEIVPAREFLKKNNSEEAKEIIIEERRQIAYRTIVNYYPEWVQLNILREGKEVIIKKMGAFIDDIREWSNNQAYSEEKLNLIINLHFPSNVKT